MSGATNGAAMTEASASVPASPVRGRGRWIGAALAWIVGILLVGLYAYETIAAVGNFIGMSGFLGSAFGPLPWFLLVAGMVFPAIALVISLIAGRGRGPAMRLLLLAAGLTGVAAIHLEIMHLIS